MIKLEDKANVNAPSSTFPYGSLRDNPGDNTGTPVNKVLVEDVMQLMEKVMDESGIIANGLPDNDVNGWQLFNAMKAVFTYREWSGIVTNSPPGLLTSVAFIDTLSLDSFPFSWDSVNQSLLTCAFVDPSYTGSDPNDFDFNFQLLSSVTSASVEQNVLMRLESVATLGSGIFRLRIRFFDASGAQKNMMSSGQVHKFKISVRRK